MTEEKLALTKEESKELEDLIDAKSRELDMKNLKLLGSVLHQMEKDRGEDFMTLAVATFLTGMVVVEIKDVKEKERLIPKFALLLAIAMKKLGLQERHKEVLSASDSIFKICELELRLQRI